jgi:hypothetical protein
VVRGAQDQLEQNGAVIQSLHADCSRLAGDIAQAAEAHWSTQKENKSLLQAAQRDGDLYRAKTEQYKHRADTARDALIRRGFDDEVRAQLIIKW